MKLNWKIVNENLEAETDSGRVFRIAGNLADGFATFSWNKSSKEAGSFVSASNSGIPTLEEAMSLCRRDAEEQEKRRETKFPSTMDATEWLVGFVDANRKLVVKAGPGAIQPALAKWFRAALSFGYDKGLLDQAKNYENARAQSEHEAEGFKFPPNPDAQVTWEKIAKFVNANFNLLWKHVETMPIRMDGLAGPEIRRKVEALEKRLNVIGTTAAKASTRVGQLWQKHVHGLREANKRIGKLEESK